MTDDTREWRNVHEVEDFPATLDLEAAATETLEWWPDRKTVPSYEEFIDRFVKDHGGSGYGPDDWDMDSYDSPAAREIMKVARRVKKEQES